MTFKTKEKILSNKIARNKRYKSKYAAIFMIENRITRRVYISSSVNADVKIHNHWSALLRNKHRNANLQADFNKYTAKKFKVILLMRLSNRELPKLKVNELNSILDSTEQYYLDKYKDKLYNRRKKSVRTVSKIVVDIATVRKRKPPKKKKK